jgi:hypothetical protein
MMSVRPQQAGREPDILVRTSGRTSVWTCLVVAIGLSTWSVAARGGGAVRTDADDAAQAGVADVLILAPSTNDLLETAIYQQYVQAQKNLQDVLQLAGMLPPGSEPRVALQPTLEQMEAAARDASAQLDLLLASRLHVHGKATCERADEARVMWLRLLATDDKTHGVTYHAWVGRKHNIKLCDKPPS